MAARYSSSRPNAACVGCATSRWVFGCSSYLVQMSATDVDRYATAVRPLCYSSSSNCCGCPHRRPIPHSGDLNGPTRRIGRGGRAARTLCSSGRSLFVSRPRNWEPHANDTHNTHERTGQVRASSHGCSARPPPLLRPNRKEPEEDPASRWQKFRTACKALAFPPSRLRVFVGEVCSLD